MSRTASLVAVGVLGVTIGAAAILAVQFIKGASEDEAPIIVKNGSTTIETFDGKWADDQGARWRNDTLKTHGNELWVRVDFTDGTSSCKASGHPVMIDYSQPGFQAIFNFANGRTNVSPKGGLTGVSNQLLQHGNHQDGGHITDVRVNGQSIPGCDSTKIATVLDEVRICSSASQLACQ